MTYKVRELMMSDASSRVVDYFELVTEGPQWFMSVGKADDYGQAEVMYEEEATRLQQEISATMAKQGWTWEMTDNALCELVNIDISMAVKMGLA